MRYYGSYCWSGGPRRGLQHRSHPSHEPCGLATLPCEAVWNNLKLFLLSGHYDAIRDAAIQKRSRAS